MAGQKAGGVVASQSVVGNAKADVAKIMAMKGPAAEVTEVASNVATVSIHVPEKRIGIVIGKNGEKVKEIQERTKVTKIDTADGIFTITGEPACVAEAKDAIQQIIDKGYCTLSYENFAENQIAVHPSCFPDIIGTG